MSLAASNADFKRSAREMKRKLTVSLVAVLALAVVGTLALSEGTVIGNWRMRTVARHLEQSKAIRDAYGPDCTVALLERGRQPGEGFHMRVHHSTPFKLQGDGVDKTIWVEWSNRNKGLDIRVHGFTDGKTPYTNTCEILK